MNGPERCARALDRLAVAKGHVGHEIRFRADNRSPWRFAVLEAATLATDDESPRLRVLARGGAALNLGPETLWACSTCARAIGVEQ